MERQLVLNPFCFRFSTARNLGTGGKKKINKVEARKIINKKRRKKK